MKHPYHRTGLFGSRKEEIRPRRAGVGPGSRVPALRCRCPRCPLPAHFGLLKGFGFPPRWRAAGHARFGLGFGFLLGYRAAGDGDDVVLYGGDFAPHARPDADGEALVNGLSYLLPVLHLVALADERRGRVQQTTAQGQVHARDLADQRDDTFFGGICLYTGVLLALPAPGEQEEGVGHPPHVGVARPQLLDAHIVQVRPTVQNREVGGVLDVEARDPQNLAHRGPDWRLVDPYVHLLAVEREELRGEGLGQEERVVDVEQGFRVVNDLTDIRRHPRASYAVWSVHEPGHPRVGGVLDEGLLLTQGVRVRHVAHIEDAVVCVLGVVGEPLPVLLVNAHGDLLEPEDRLQGVENLEELLEVLFV